MATRATQDAETREPTAHLYLNTAAAVEEASEGFVLSLHSRIVDPAVERSVHFTCLGSGRRILGSRTTAFTLPLTFLGNLA